MSVSIYDFTLYFPADRSGSAVVLRELLLHVRQPDVLTKQRDHGHEHGEQWKHVCISVLTVLSYDSDTVMAGSHFSFPKIVFSGGISLSASMIHAAVSEHSDSVSLCTFGCDMK